MTVIIKTFGGKEKTGLYIQTQTLFDERKSTANKSIAAIGA